LINKSALLSTACSIVLLGAMACSSARSTQVGRASYYGPGYKGKTTACGEKFKPKKRTAAHGSHPCGTILKVTNLANKKTVTVRVNDHFPGTNGRIIDLSEGAFKKIANKDTGVIEVQLKVVRKPRS